MTEVSRPTASRTSIDDYQTSDFSSGHYSLHLDSSTGPRLTDTNARSSSSGGYYRMTEMKLKAAELDGGNPPERRKDYKGRIRTWPGLLLLTLIVGGAVAVMTLQVMDNQKVVHVQQEKYEQRLAEKRKIKDGLDDDKVIISDDGQVGNPKSYPDMGCEQPDYQSKDGQIFAVSENGTEVPVGIKGVNWFGMETGLAIPFGLWENEENGTSVYEIAAFLARNNFNAVRLPVCIKNILNDVVPEKSLINVNTNRAVNISSYVSTIQSIVKALGFRQVSVLISLHTLDPKESGGAWYDEKLNVTEDQFLEAVDILTKNLCGPTYWNILGLDMKNEPYECSWGGDAPDWQKGATLIGNRMLEGCPNWMAFVEGIANSGGKITLNGETSGYYDWWGGGMEHAADYPITFDIENKLVWAPHYYNTGVSVAWYFYGGGTQNAEGGLDNYVELDDATLKSNVAATMNIMFGYLRASSPYAMVMGEFAGLYATDKHPKLTTKRTTDFTIETMIENGYAGGFMWSLNPESAYQYNPADTYGTFTEGLLEDDWLTPNKVFLEGMSALNAIQDVKPFPCFPRVIDSSSGSE